MLHLESFGPCVLILALLTDVKFDFVWDTMLIILPVRL